MGAKYDFGGGCKFTAYAEDFIIVDIEPPDRINREIGCFPNCPHQPSSECKKTNYIQADIFQKNLVLPEKASHINASSVLRYYRPEGHLDGHKVNHKKLLIAAQNIERNCEKKATVTLSDHIAVLEDVIEYLISKGFKLIECYMVEPRDGDYPAIWDCVLKRR